MRQHPSLAHMAGLMSMLGGSRAFAEPLWPRAYRLRPLRTSKYMPHQGAREVLRRQVQANSSKAKRYAAAYGASHKKAKQIVRENRAAVFAEHYRHAQ